METITLEVLNQEVVPVLNGLERLGLIKLMSDSKAVKTGDCKSLKEYWGAMHSESVAKLDAQLDEHRNAWK